MATPLGNADDLVAITGQSRVEFRALKVHRQPGRDPLLVCPELGHYMEVEEDTLTAVRVLSESATVAEAEARLLAETGEEYDLVALANLLLSKGFVARVDGGDLTSDAPRGKGRSLFSWVTPRAARAIRHPLVLAGAAFLVLQYVLALLAGAIEGPHYADALLTSRPLLNVSLALGGMLLMAYLHELAHYFTARSYGLDPKIALNHRFYMVVLTTDVTDAWMLPRRPQLAIFGAGILFNLSMIGVGGMLLLLGGAGLLDLAGTPERVVRFFVLVNAFPLVFQLFLVARTDLYYILQSLAGNRNLSQDAIAWLRMRLVRAWKLLRRQPHAACGRCRGKLFPTEPFCVRCGTTQRVANPNLYAFRYQDRRLLTAFGLVSAAGFVLLVPLMVYTSIRVLRLLGTILVGAPPLLAAGEWLLLGEVVLAAFFLGLVVSFLLLAALRLVALPVKLAWQLTLSRFQKLPVPARRVVMYLLLAQARWNAAPAARLLQRLRPKPRVPAYQPRWAGQNPTVQNRSENP